ncbi:anaerobic ribonucleoside-triphosphate reductase activating protein [Pyrobaculum islandicum DSM 4184]|uniref:Anaerobic ribonucleoside-triphosphate reductase activating protein n=2 Tax=Pyrobaculum islandicum TaxID=2277 RepID=A1RR24_PYRIL|nr:anaerobic ribonucleoside-triphosphate reductase activating protein [Pyrobaculum islandicum DSM 4184]
MLAAGWKGISTVDVHGAVTFTLWLCGCNLRCPFCHNWRIAERQNCGELDVERLLGELARAKPYIDYLHVTGGEPLLQAEELRHLFKRAREAGVARSLNTNATLTKALEKVIDEVDHLATDLKIPDQMYGVPHWQQLWQNFLTSLKTASSRKIPIELRIPAANLPLETYAKRIEEVSNALAETEVTVVIQPLLGPPTTDPRDPQWCRQHCNPPPSHLQQIAKLAAALGKVVIKNYGIFTN